MAACSVPGAGTVLLLNRSLESFGNAEQRSLAPQLQPPGTSDAAVRGNTGGLGQCEAGDVSCSGDLKGVGHPQSAREEALCRKFFLEPSMWWDYRQQKQSAELPDIGYKESSAEVLCLKSLWKSAWVDDKLVAFDRQLRLTPSTSNSTILKNDGPQRVGAYAPGFTAEAVNKLCLEGRLLEATDGLGFLVQTEPVPISLIYTILKKCVAQKNLVLGRRVHEVAVRGGYESNTFLASHILRMYASHGRLQEAKDVFTRVAEPDVFMWSAVIAAHAKHGEPKQAIELYQMMRRSSVKPDTHLYVAALQACAGAADLDCGRQVHADLLASDIQPNMFIWNCLVDMYAKCGKLEEAREIFDNVASRNVVTCNIMITGYAKSGRLEEARKIFDSSVVRDVVTWTAMIAGYSQHEQAQEALTLFKQMEAEGVVLADPFTFACLLKACASVRSLELGEELHAQIRERRLEGDVVVGTCLVDMYAKCGRVEEARGVFDSLVIRDVVTWNAMIAGYAEHGFGQEALALYARMEKEGMFLADTVTFACLLKACATAGALQQGEQICSKISERGLGGNIYVGNSLVDMYAKCGRLEDARRVFDGLLRKDVVTWNALMNGFGLSNEGEKAIQCFQEMLREGVQANESTFTCLFVACSHAGLVEEGRQFFKHMVEECGIKPTIEHNTCMVDLLGRAGHLQEAEDMLSSFESNYVGSMCLLNACKSHGDVERGNRCFENLLRWDPQNASAYVLMGKIYAEAGRWSDVARIERLRKFAGAHKKAAVAGIEVNRQVHTFHVGDETGDISSKARGVNLRLRKEGHVPLTELVLKPLPEKEKEDELCGHAEKLALAFGLLNTPDGTPLLVTKNLRMCGDCHSSTEIMSRVEIREIIVRDAHRVHRFVDGSCRCGGRP